MKYIVGLMLVFFAISPSMGQHLPLLSNHHDFYSLRNPAAKDLFFILRNKEGKDVFNASYKMQGIADAPSSEHNFSTFLFNYSRGGRKAVERGKTFFVPFQVGVMADEAGAIKVTEAHGRASVKIADWGGEQSGVFRSSLHVGIGAQFGNWTINFDEVEIRDEGDPVVAADWYSGNNYLRGSAGIFCKNEFSGGWAIYGGVSFMRSNIDYYLFYNLGVIKKLGNSPAVRSMQPQNDYYLEFGIALSQAQSILHWEGNVRWHADFNKQHQHRLTLGVGSTLDNVQLECVWLHNLNNTKEQFLGIGAVYHLQYPFGSRQGIGDFGINWRTFEARVMYMM